MSRAVRMVPLDWEHPKDARGHYRPLHDETYADALAAYEEARRAFDAGESVVCGTSEPAKDSYTFVDWHGEPPDPDYYRPAFGAEAVGLQMYETTTEGTPISPVCRTAEELADWLASNDASAFGRLTATRDEWLAIITDGGSYGLLVGPDGTRPHVPKAGGAA